MRRRPHTALLHVVLSLALLAAGPVAATAGPVAGGDTHGMHTSTGSSGGTGSTGSTSGVRGGVNMGGGDPDNSGGDDTWRGGGHAQWAPVGGDGKAMDNARRHARRLVAAATAALTAVDRHARPTCTCHTAARTRTPSGVVVGAAVGVEVVRDVSHLRDGDRRGATATATGARVTVIVVQTPSPSASPASCWRAVRQSHDLLPRHLHHLPVVYVDATPHNAAHPTSGTASRPRDTGTAGGITRVQSLAAAVDAVATPYALVLLGDTVVSPVVTEAAVVTALQGSGLAVAGGMVEVEGGGAPPTGGAKQAPATGVGGGGGGAAGTGVTLEPSCFALKAVNYTASATPGSPAPTVGAAGVGGCLACDHTSTSFAMDVGRFRAAPALHFNTGGDIDAPHRGPHAAVVDMFLRASATRRHGGGGRSMHSGAPLVGTCPGLLQLRRPRACVGPVPPSAVLTAMAPVGKRMGVSQWRLPGGAWCVCSACGP